MKYLSCILSFLLYLTMFTTMFTCINILNFNLLALPNMPFYIVVNGFYRKVQINITQVPAIFVHYNISKLYDSRTIQFELLYLLIRNYYYYSRQCLVTILFCPVCLLSKLYDSRTIQFELLYLLIRNHYYYSRQCLVTILFCPVCLL